MMSNLGKGFTPGDTTRRSDINSLSSFTPDTINIQREDVLDDLIQKVYGKINKMHEQVEVITSQIPNQFANK